MKITFLGTGTSSGVPMIGCNCAVCLSDNPKDKRLRSSVLVETQGKTFVIDTGPDFRQQMLREKVSCLDAVIFTHEHKDHVAGLDDVRAFNFIQNKPMDVYATENVQIALQREFHYVFSGIQYPGIPKIKLHLIDGDTPFFIDGVEFRPVKVFHHKLPVLGFRIGDFTYITDANNIPDAEKVKIRGSRVLVLNALRSRHHLSHFTLEQAVSLMEELKPEKGFFTHISHQLGLHDAVEKGLPDFVKIAYDSLRIEI